MIYFLFSQGQPNKVMEFLRKNQNKSVLLPTAYLPPLEYFVALIQHNTGYVELHETWVRQSWRNRCHISSANGPLNLILPVCRPNGNHTKTKDVLISHHDDWQKQHWQSIRSAYGNAPFYFHYKELLEPFFRENPEKHLWIFNYNLLKSVLDEIQLPAEVDFTKEFTKNPVTMTDLRTELTPKSHRRKILPVKNWKEYYQVFSDRHGFIPNLSIIDLLFHLGPDSRCYLLETADGGWR